MWLWPPKIPAFAKVIWSDKKWQRIELVLLSQWAERDFADVTLASEDINLSESDGLWCFACGDVYYHNDHDGRDPILLIIMILLVHFVCVSVSCCWSEQNMPGLRLWMSHCHNHVVRNLQLFIKLCLSYICCLSFFCCLSSLICHAFLHCDGACHTHVVRNLWLFIKNTFLYLCLYLYLCLSNILSCICVLCLLFCIVFSSSIISMLYLYLYTKIFAWMLVTSMSSGIFGCLSLI